MASESRTVWYESKELIDHSEWDYANYDGMFELNLSSWSTGEPLLSKKVFKPIHGRGGQEPAPLVYNGISNLDYLAPKNQAADSIVRLQAKLESLTDRLATLESALQQFRHTEKSEKGKSEEAYKKFNWISLIKGLFWLLWPILVKAIFNSFSRTSIMIRRS